MKVFDQMYVTQKPVDLSSDVDRWEDASIPMRLADLVNPVLDPLLTSARMPGGGRLSKDLECRIREIVLLRSSPMIREGMDMKAIKRLLSRVIVVTMKEVIRTLAPPSEETRTIRPDDNDARYDAWKCEDWR